MAATFGFHRFGAEPEDHITNLVAFMAHIVSLQETAMVDDRVGEAVYLEGIAEWLRSAHLAWFTEDLVMALVEIEVCYLSHVARALEMRVHPAGDTTGARRRPSDDEVAEALSKREPSG